MILLISTGIALFRPREVPKSVPTPSTSQKPRDVGAGDDLFAREGNGVLRDPRRQVTLERNLTPGFELDLGRFSGRQEAEALRLRASREGLEAFVVRDSSGQYRVVAGPLATAEEARSAASRLSARLKRTVRVQERQP